MVSGTMRGRRGEPTVEGDVYMITEPRMKNKIIILFIIIINYYYYCTFLLKLHAQKQETY